MAFNSYTFLLFFLVVLGLHYLPFGWKLKKANLLWASYLFYAAWNPPFVVLLWISTLVDWFCARRMAGAHRRVFLVLSLLVNLGLLGFFKYGGFVLENFVAFVQTLGIDYQPAAPDIILPVGISFYTFQTLSYTIDVYRGKLQPWPSFLDYALYVTFFPQLVAGPIVRATEFLPQCITPRRASVNQLGWGLTLLVVGLFEKVVVADGLLAPIADDLYGAVRAPTFTAAWYGTLAFAGQIFCDFAGYSSCAIGVAMCLGFRLPDNFRFPYAAIGFSDFWRRWHISLSSWLRDYLYIPLGGNRRGRIRIHVNLAVTMLLGGLWHGASWTFVVWGALHGGYLVLERLAKACVPDRPFWHGPLGRLLLGLLTFTLVCVAWVFFRAQSFPQAWDILSAMLGFSSSADAEMGLHSEQALAVRVVIFFLLLVHWRLRDSSFEEVVAHTPWGLRAFVLAAMLVSIFNMPGADRAFLYFQF